MCWNVRFFHCWKAIDITQYILVCSGVQDGFIWLNSLRILNMVFFYGDVVISPMPQPPTLKDHGIPPCLPTLLKSVWHGWSYQHLGCCKHRFWVHWCKQAHHLAKICIPKDRGTIMGVSCLSFYCAGIVLNKWYLNFLFAFFNVPLFFREAEEACMYVYKLDGALCPLLCVWMMWEHVINMEEIKKHIQ